MSKHSQANRPLQITTKLDPDTVLVEQLAGHESLSELFRFQLDLLAEQPLPFERLIGQPATVKLATPAGPIRYFNGILCRLTQDGRIPASGHMPALLRYQAELVPRFWLLTRRVQSRVFQQLSIPAILQQVLRDEWQLDVSFEYLQDFQPRPYCVQYRESDFAFVSRIMEDEGIYYMFEHTAEGHKLLVSDRKFIHPPTPEPSRISFDEIEGGQRDEPRITRWKKTQELRSCKVTLWDHCFELPGQHLEAEQPVRDTVPVGQGDHRLNHQVRVNDLEMLEIYDYPGSYAHYFDGVTQDGVEQPDQLRKIFDDNKRLVRIRIEQEANHGLFMEGTSNCAHFNAGWYFVLEQHGEENGAYLLTRVEHAASQKGAFASGDAPPMSYENRFTCISNGMAYRPSQVTPKPRIDSAQTATVVGPPGEEIHCDLYGRVKVQFPWDRRGYRDCKGRHVLHDSSCWVRVAQAWAGKGYGAIHIPRVGQEVVVNFLDGDPDRPLIVGSVYNADQMPPHALPAQAHRSGFKSHSVGGDPNQFSGLVLHDQLGAEQVQLHAERDMSLSTENNKVIYVGADQEETVGGTHKHTVGGDHQIAVSGDHKHTVANVYRLSVGASAGSGSGGGDWPWDFSSGTGTGTNASIAGSGGAFFQDVWGVTSELVVGVYNCTVIGLQSYVTVGAYLSAVAISNWNFIGGWQFNCTAGPVYNLHESGFTKVGLAPIALATASTMTLTGTAQVEVISDISVAMLAAPGGIIIRPDSVILGFPGCTITIEPTGITLEAGPNVFNLSTAGDFNLTVLNGVDLFAAIANKLQTLEQSIL